MRIRFILLNCSGITTRQQYLRSCHEDFSPWEAPDYRFSLANERTFLAWIRTALGFLAAGVGLDQLAPDFATPVIREALALLLCLFAGGLAIYGYLRWLRNEKAMRLKEDLPYTHSLLIISVMLTIVAVIVMTLVLYAG